MELPGDLIVRRWWLVLVIAALIAGAAGYAIAAAQEPTYESEAQLLVGSTSDDLSNIRASQAQAETLAELAVRTPTLTAAAERANETIDPATFRLSVRARANELTRILSIRVRRDDPNGAASLANALARELIVVADRTANDASSGRLTVIERAAPDPVPVSPNKLLVTGLAALAGLAVAFLLALVVELATDRVRDAADVEKLTGAPCISILQPRRRLLRRLAAPTAGYALVAAALDARDGTPAARTVSVTSESGDVSTMEVGLRLSEILGEAGHDVVLVDADPARVLTTKLGLTGQGLGELVATRDYADTEEIARRLVLPTTLPGVKIVAAGNGAAHSIDTDQAGKVLQRLLNETGRVVVMTGTAGDGQTVGWTRSTDAVLLVADNSARRSSLGDAARALRTAGASLTATLLRTR